MKLTTLVHTSNEQAKFEMKNNTIYIGTPRNEIIINITKYVQDLYEENYKTLIKEIKVLNKRRYSSSWIGQLNIAKMSILLKLIYRFNEIQ